VRFGNAQQESWLRKFSRNWPGPGSETSYLGLKTGIEASRLSKEWRKETTKTRRSEFVKVLGYRASAFNGLEYLDVVNNHVFDLFHLILEGM